MRLFVSFQNLIHVLLLGLGIVNLRVIVPALAAILTMSIGGTQAQAQSSTPTRFVCDSNGYAIFGSSPSEVQRVNVADLSTTTVGLLNPAITANAIGFNPLDEYIYGLSNGSAQGIPSKNIVRIGANGALENIGKPTGSGAFNPVSNNGTVDTSGNWFGLSNSLVYKVPLGTDPAFGTLTFTTASRSGVTATPTDITFSPFDGMLYGRNAGNLVRINPNTGFGENVTTSGPLPNGAGGIWADAAGKLFLYNNGGGTLSELDLTQSPPLGTLIGNVPANTNFDATACIPPKLTKNASVAQANAGGSFDYTYSITNGFSFPITVDFDDVLSSELTYDLASLSSPNPGGGTVSTFDATTLDIDGVSISGFDTLTFTVSVDVGAGVAGGTLVDNQAFITRGGVTLPSDDPDTPAIGDPTRVEILASTSSGPTINPSVGSCVAVGGTYSGINLINGGDFSLQGDLAANIPGSTTAYTHQTAGSYVDGWPNNGSFEPNDGRYVITSRSGPVQYGSVSAGTPYWHDLTGVQAATDPNDKFMIINADSTPGETFQTSVAVEQGKTYEFSAYISNMFVPQNRILPNLAYEYSENGGATWTRLIESGDVAETAAPEWNQSSGILVPTSTGTILVRLITIAPGGGGNDFAIDELLFQECVLPFERSDAPADGSAAPAGGTTAYGVATHDFVPAIRLGATIDEDAGPITSPDANGDGTDDDGVDFSSITLTQAGTTTIPVTVSGAGGFLQGWFDWDGDGNFTGTNDQIALNVQDGGAGDTDGSANGTVTLSVPVPSNAITNQTFARFRWSTTQNLNSTIDASDGEVEDYAVTVNAAPVGVCTPVFNTEVARNLYFFEFNGLTVGATPVNRSYTLPDGRAVTLTLQRTSGINVEGVGLNSGRSLYPIVNGGNNWATITSPTLRTVANGPPGTFKVTFSQPLDIFTADGEASGSAESFEVTTTGGDWEQIDGVNQNGYVLTGAAGTKTWGLVGSPTSGSGNYGTPVMVTRNTSEITVQINNSGGGRTGVVFGVHMPDIGDAPADYGVAAHRVSNFNPACTNYGVDTLYLGSIPPDGEHPDAVQSADATGDQTAGLYADEDGVSAFPTMTTGDTGYTLPAANVTAAGTGTLHAWIDFDGDDSFDTDEHTTVAVSGGTLAGDLVWSGGQVMTATASTFVRLRLTSDTLTSADATGFASDGEVEDYEVTVEAVAAPVTQVCSGYFTTIYDPNTTLTDTGYDGFNTTPSNPVGTFDYNEFANTAQHLSIKVTEWGNASLMTDGVGDDAGYTGPVLDNNDWDRAVDFTRTIQPGEAGDYSVELLAGDDHVFIFRNGVQIYAQANAYSVAPTTLPNLTLASNDVLTIRVVEEHLANTALDLRITPLFASSCGQTDFSDAPADGGTAPDSNFNTAYGEASHRVVAGILLGTEIDADTASLASLSADGDDVNGTPDDEDGVSIPQLVQGASATIPVTVAGAGGVLQAWIDWNGDGDFNDTVDGISEQIATNLSDGGGLDTDAATGAIAFSVTVPVSAITTQQTFARFRWSTTSDLDSTTAASDGEVEDYAVPVTPLTPAPILVCFGGPADYSYMEVSNVTTSSAIGTISSNVDGDQIIVNVTSSNNNLLLAQSTTNNDFPWNSYGGAGTQNPDPFGSDGIGHANNGSYTFSFDSPVYNPIVALFSMGQNGQSVTWTFTDLSGAPLDVTIRPPGFNLTQPTQNSITGTEGHGTIQLNGEVNGFIATASGGPEFWSGLLPGTLCREDFSDAPISTTNYGGASHGLDGQTYLGTSIDFEFSDFDSANADGDVDNGVVLPTLYRGAPATITATVAGAGGKLQAWIDWNGDGTFDAGEQVATDLSDGGGLDTDAASGTIAFSVTPPVSAVMTQTFARFRWSTISGLSSIGPASNGEIEDYALTLAQADHADAPGTYGAPYHAIVGGIRLGATNTDEGSGYNDPAANADGSDDGVSFSGLEPGNTGTITVSTFGSGFLQAWMDWDGDGVFDDPSEQIAADLQDYGTGTISIPVTVPAYASGAVIARFRWSSDFGIGSDGFAPDGEVEDYLVPLGTGGTLLSGQVFLDTGAGGGTAHDAVLNGTEVGTPNVAIEIFETAGNTVIATGTIDAAGNWTARLPDGFTGEVQVVTTPGAGLRSISEQTAGLPGVVNPDPNDGTIVFTPVAGTGYPGIDLGVIAEPLLSQDQVANLSPGQTALLPHSYIATTTGSVQFSITGFTSNPADAFSTTLFEDTNCDGAPDTVISGLRAVIPGETICLLARTQASNGISPSANATYSIEAVTGFANTVVTSTLTNMDAINGGTTGEMVLRKLVRNTSEIGSQESTQNSGSIGDVLQYRIIMSNPGQGPATNLSVFDRTPAYTALSAPIVSPVAVASGVTCTLVVPVTGSNTTGYQGPLEWSCPGQFAPGESGSVTFEVAITP